MPFSEPVHDPLDPLRKSPAPQAGSSSEPASLPDGVDTPHSPDDLDMEDARPSSTGKVPEYFANICLAFCTVDKSASWQVLVDKLNRLEALHGYVSGSDVSLFTSHFQSYHLYLCLQTRCAKALQQRITC